MFSSISNHIGNNFGDIAKILASAFSSRVAADGGVTEATDCLRTRVRDLKTRGIWDKASVIWLPHGYKEGKLYAVKGGAGADLGFTRGGTRKRKGATYVEEVPYNLLQFSEQFDNAAWTKVNLTVTANATTAPNNTTTGDKLVEDAVLNNHAIRQATSIVSGNAYTYTVIVKAAERSNVQLTFGTGAFTNNQYANFNLSTGVVGTKAAETTASITSLGNGWYRIRATATATVTTTESVNIVIALSDSAGFYPSYAGDGVSGIYVWRAQHLVGSVERDDFPTTNRQNVPAIDYTGSTCPSLSLEPARTNLLLQSEAFNNASWTKLNTTVTANAIAGPDNLSTADAIFETVTNGTHQVYQPVTKAASVLKYAFSLFLKPNGRDWVSLELTDGGANGARKYFNIATGVIGSTVIAGTGVTLDDFQITPSANGFYRCEIVATTTTTTTVTANTNIATGDGVVSYIGDVTKGLHYYGAQLEQASYATSYIKTEAATVSRVADAVTALTGVSNLIGQTEGTIYFEGSSFTDGAHKVIGISDGTVNNEIVLNFSATNTINALALSGGVTQASITGPAFVSGTKYKVAITYKANKIALFVDGVKSAEDLTATIPATSRVMLSENGVNIFYGRKDALTLSTTALSDAEAITLTTP